jgi:hypothetical protein
MQEFKYESYCGLYCGACEIMVAYRRGLTENKVPRWEDLHDPLRKILKPGEIKCFGCKTDTVFQGCAVCPIRKCGRKKPDIETCLDCARFPCFRFSLMKFVRKFLGYDKKLPHLKTVSENQCTIKEKGVSVWLAEQQNQWQCPGCHTAISWYQEKCSICGRDLEPPGNYIKAIF